MNQSIFVVLGMPRSGTSVIMRGLKALGIEIGEKLVPASTVWNPTGFWEDQEISRSINCGVFFALDYIWDSVSIVDPALQQDKKLIPLKNHAIELLTKRLQGKTAWGFKDPRTAKILPFWQSVFSDMNLQEKYVIALRNPLAVASSYHQLRKFDVEAGLLFWLMHLIPAIDETHHKDRIIVSYEAMLRSPENELARIREYFSLTDNSPHEISAFCQGFLDKGLEHFKFFEDSLETHPAIKVVPLAGLVYSLLYDVAMDKLSMQSPVFLKAWQDIKNEFEKLSPLFTYIDRLLKKNKQYEKNLRSRQRSLLFKLAWPLYWIDEKLRIVRHQQREKRKLKKECF